MTIREIVKPTKNTYLLNLPDEMIGKTVEVIAFEIEKDSESIVADSTLQDIQKNTRNTRRSRTRIINLIVTRLMTTSKIFVDSNIILYLFDVDKTKRHIAEQHLLKKPLVSAQVLTEVANVCKRRFKYSKEQILNLWSDLLSDCILTFTDTSTFKLAIELSKKYDFQVYDSLIVASALNSDCKILYSEDMQNLLQIESKLIITNPFR